MALGRGLYKASRGIDEEIHMLQLESLLDKEFGQIVSSQVLTNLTEIQSTKLKRLKSDLEKLLDKSIEIEYKADILRYEAVLRPALDYLNGAQQVARTTCDKVSMLTGAKAQKDKLNADTAVNNSREVIKALSRLKDHW